MTEMPDRFTSNIALMLQEQWGRSHDRSTSGWQGFSAAMAVNHHYLSSPSLAISLSNTFPVISNNSLGFLLLESALSGPGYSVQMPIPDHRQAGNGSGAFSWSGLWGGLGSLLNQSLERFGRQNKSSISVGPRSLLSTQVGVGLTERVIVQRSTPAPGARDTITSIPVSQPRTTIQHALHQPLSLSLPAQPTTNRWSRTFTSQIVSPAITNSVSNLTNSFTQALAQRPSTVASPSLREPLQRSQPVSSLTSLASLTSFPAPENTPHAGSQQSFPQPSAYRSPVVDQILQIRAAAPSKPQSQTAESTSSTTPPITIQGGIHVQITAQTIDPAHAEATARTIADQMLKELNRITERDRFRRGLPTSPLR